MPRERVDAVVVGLRARPRAGRGARARSSRAGSAIPRPRLLVPGARFARPAPDGRGAPRSLLGQLGRRAARARSRSAATGGSASRPDEPVDATFRLERNVWNGAVEPRLVLRHARPCAPDADRGPRRARRLPGGGARRARARRPGEPPRAGRAWRATSRTVLDRRGESPLAVLARRACAGGGAGAGRVRRCRRAGCDGLRERTGGFALIGHHALERDPALADGSRSSSCSIRRRCADAAASCSRTGRGFTHLAWGDAELRFAQQMHELEYGLRASLVALYRGLQAPGEGGRRGARAPASRRRSARPPGTAGRHG